MSLITRPICLLSFGHDYQRHGDYLVCRVCGHRIRVVGQ